MSVKLIAVDMDGTFLSDAKTYNRPRFLAQYARMKAQGIRFVVASGNQYYQLRIYESHSEMAGRKKVEMFNTAELAIFRRSGMEPVFFGQTIIGPNMPNLTYMLSFKDVPAKEAGWKTFIGDPEWAKLKTTPGFTDKEIVFRITNLMLVPAAYTQI